jgi:CTP synthase
MAKYIFVVGGVMSSVGKGVAAASVSKIIQSKGHKVANIKCDMYVNIDAGTIRPAEHGEVFVGEDGVEADQDLGNYERYTDETCTMDNYITTGQVYQEVIRKERNLEYEGEDVEVVPDIPNEIIRRIKACQSKNEADVVVVEFGGTVGEYQLLLFLEAARMMKARDPEDVAFIMVSYLPTPSLLGEQKSKPTQYAIRTLNSAGIQPDFIMCRADLPVSESIKNTISTVCSLSKDRIISAPDVNSIYDVPVNFEKENLGEKLLKILNLEAKKTNMEDWVELSTKIKTLTDEVTIGVVGKYFNFKSCRDTYISVLEAINHATWLNNKKVNILWLDSEKYEEDPSKLKELDEVDGIVVPGGFGSRGVEGIIASIKYARENDIPFLGLCYGLQLATIEFARNVCGIAGATSTEIDENAEHQVIHVMADQIEKIKKKDYGATMRLGAYPCVLDEKSKSFKAYGSKDISERHRHRYEVNNDYRGQFEKSGLLIAGTSPDKSLVEIIELPNHPFFVATQFHPEFKSRPITGHPLFNEFIKASIARKK